MRVRFSRLARADLVDIYRYLRDHDPTTAARVVARPKGRCLSLSRLSKRGALMRLSDGRTARRLVEGAYVIVYDATEQDITISRILHGSRDISAILTREGPPDEANSRKPEENG